MTVCRMAGFVLCIGLPPGVAGPDVVRASAFLPGCASPRGAQALVLFGKIRALLEGRFNAAFQDIAVGAADCLRHRMILNFEGEAEGITSDEIIADIIENIPTAAEQPA